MPIGMAITEVAAVMGENTNLEGLQQYLHLQMVFSTYLHTNPAPGLGRIAGILSLELEDGCNSSVYLQHVGSELARKDLVSSDALENEREILSLRTRRLGILRWP